MIRLKNNGFKRAAITESIPINASHGTWNIDGGQRTAEIESTPFNASHGIWNINGC